MNSNNHEIIMETLWALVNLSAITEIVQQLIDANLIVFAIKAINWQSFTIKSPALKIIGNICANTHEHTQYILNFGLLDMVNHDSYIQSELANDIFWITSNIAAGTPNQVKLLMSHQIFESVIFAIIHYDMPARIQATNTLKILIKNYKEITKSKIVHMDIFSILCIALRDNNADYLKNILDICEELLNKESLNNGIEESGLFFALEKIVKYNNEIISKKALEILSGFR